MPDPSPEIRTVLPTEYAAVAELTVDVYVAGGWADPDYRPVLADVAGRAAAAEVLVAILAGRIVGSVTFARPDSPYAEITRGPEEAAFRMLVVDPAVRGQGIGPALVDRCVELARAAGAGRLVISSEVTMTTAHRMYDRLGFRRAPDRDWSPVPGVQLLCYTLELDADGASVSTASRSPS